MKKLVIEYWSPLVVWLLVIFLFSTDAFSANHTASIIYAVLQFFFPWMSAQQLEFWHIVVRKAAHITEYFVLALFAYRTFKRDQTDVTQAKLRTMFFVALAASCDEIHQWFTLFRGASPIDVGYDCFGALSALWIISLYETWRLRTRALL